MIPPSTAPTCSPATLREDVLEGLRANPRTLPTQLLYDVAGSHLFERITTLPEYYLTRTEAEILRGCLREVASLVGQGALVVEPGSGNGEKARLLLNALDRPAAYVPVDVAEGQLRALRRRLGEKTSARILPVVADYSENFDLPVAPHEYRRTLVFFPGSTVGNFPPHEAAEFLGRLGAIAGPGGALLLGADLEKPRNVVEPAYNDATGVTAEFNRNVIRHVNRLLGTTLDPLAFRHHAPWIPEWSRIEMRLVSERDQSTMVPTAGSLQCGFGSRREGTEGETIRIGAGEAIVTEHSYKHTPEALERIVVEGGWKMIREWRDARGWYSVQLLERASVPHDLRM
jgi:dimethylhistidine N-methyltransferase